VSDSTHLRKGGARQSSARDVGEPLPLRGRDSQPRGRARGQEHSMRLQALALGIRRNPTKDARARETPHPPLSPHSPCLIRRQPAL
jgi:hypothetical protein